MPRFTLIGLACTEPKIVVEDLDKALQAWHRWITNHPRGRLGGMRIRFLRDEPSILDEHGKGPHVLIEGRLKLVSWESNGQKRSKLKVVGERPQMFGSRSSDNGDSGGRRRSSESRRDDDREPVAQTPAAAGFADEDVPFSEFLRSAPNSCEFG